MYFILFMFIYIVSGSFFLGLLQVYFKDFFKESELLGVILFVIMYPLFVFFFLGEKARSIFLNNNKVKDIEDHLIQ